MCPCWSGRTGMTGVLWNLLQRGSLSPRKRSAAPDPVPWGGAGKCPVPCVTVRAKTEERDLRRQRAGCRDVSGVFLCARAPGGRCLVRG